MSILVHFSLGTRRHILRIAFNDGHSRMLRFLLESVSLVITGVYGIGVYTEGAFWFNRE